MYFAMNQDDIDNDIAYVADVEEIISYGVSDVMFMRTDNLELNEKILKTVERN